MKYVISNFFILIQIFFIGSIVHAQSQTESEVFTGHVDAILTIPEYRVDEVIPGYKRPLTVAPSLLVGDFSTKSKDGFEWGGLIARILRWDLMFSPNVQLRMPDYNFFYQDSWRQGMDVKDRGRSMESLNIAAHRLGINNILTGEISVDGDEYQIEASIINVTTQGVMGGYVEFGSLVELPSGLRRLSRKIFLDLGIDESLTPGYDIKGNALSKTNFERAAWLFSGANWNTQDEGIQNVKQMWRQGDRMLPVAAAYLYFMPVGDDLTSYHDRLNSVSDYYPGNVGIDFAVARYMGYRGDESLMLEKLSKLKQLVRQNPNDPTMMIVLADELAKARLTLESLTLCIESLRRWPDNYRVWWNMAYALSRHAWLVRGNDYWEDVSERAKDAFVKLNVLAKQAVDKAVSMNPDNSDLWVMKVTIANGYNDEMLKSFYRAIELNPQNRTAYESALSYSLKRWGGSYAKQQEIFELADMNIHDDHWKSSLRVQYEEPAGIGDEFFYKLQKFFRF